MRFLAFLIFLTFCGFFLAGRWYFVCVVRNNCPTKYVDLVEVPELNPTLAFTNNGKTLISGFDQFPFEEGSAQVTLNANNEAFLDSVAAFMDEYTGSHLNIRASFPTGEEGASGIFENVGLARANKVRGFLAERGVEQDRMTLDYHEIGANEVGYLELNAYLPGTNTSTESDNKLTFSFDEMTFSSNNFETYGKQVQLSPSFQFYADSLSRYLKNNSDKTLQIIGHTDLIETDAYNIKLGQKRADAAKSILVKQYNIPEARIKASSKGESSPIAPNNTEANRKKNRRVEFIIE